MCKKNRILLSGDIYEKPANSGMISVVFKGYRTDIDENIVVVIKMKRKNIDEKLTKAIKQLQFVVWLLSKLPWMKKYRMGDIVNKNVEFIRSQTNFLEEIDNMDLIRENCKHLKYIKIPSANRSVTLEYPNIIVMDYIKGMKINEIQEEDYNGFAKQVVKFGLTTTLLHGVTHGDLHGGNILFIKEEGDTKYPYKLGILDFGIIYHLNEEYKTLLFDILTQMFEVSPRESAIRLLNSGIIEPRNLYQIIPAEHYENIVKFTEDIISETIHSSKKANQLQIYKFLCQLNDYLTKSDLIDMGICPSDEFVKTQLILAMAHGVTLTLCKGEFIGLMDNVLNELFHTEIIF
jgi:hypothetical protein